MKSRSPLKDKPLRNPGQSVREQRVELVFDKFLGPVVIASMLGLWAAMDWMRYLFPSRPNPWLPTGFALAALGYLAWQSRRHWPRIRQLKQAEDGEKHVGQLLEGLRASGYEVFHDIVAPGFNVDHVILGPSGVLTIETKTWSKPQRGNAKIEFDGEALTVAGRRPDRDPIIQARAQANWLQQLLAESTGKTFAVRPVVLFPGWFIEDGRKGRKELWVLEPKGLPAFLAQEKAVLPPEDVKLAAFHLSRFVRAGERSREEKAG